MADNQHLKAALSVLNDVAQTGLYPDISRLAEDFRNAVERDQRDEWEQDAKAAIERRMRLNGWSAKAG